MRVIVEVALLSGHYPVYDYIADGDLAIGQLICVPVRRNISTGIVLACKQKTAIVDKKLKSITEVCHPISLHAIWPTILWCANYYHCPVGQVAKLALPGISECKRYEDLDLLSQIFRILPVAKPRLSPAQNKLYDRIKTDPKGVSLSILMAEGFRQQTIDKLLMQQVIEKRLPDERALCLDASMQLNQKQQAVVDSVGLSDGFATHVLFGITGSGKTEVYFGLIEKVIGHHKQALLLVPEIGLTPQMLSRIQRRFSGLRLLVTHSKLSAVERLRVLKTIHQDDVDVVIGTRSAIFSPLLRLGIIILDEEHDASYRQQSGLRYSARDLAVIRAKQVGIPLMLGSATPSLESLHNVSTGRYECHYLTQRHGQFQQSSVHVLDIRGHRLIHGIDPRIVEKIRQNITQSRGVLVFVNRRGYAPVLLCRACGWSCRCDACDSYMVWHRYLNGLQCHHCGRTQPLPVSCQSCGGEDTLVPVGYGTERMESVLKELFPDQTIVRVDRDSKVDISTLASQLSSGEVDIVIGTQMLAKGHHFPSLSLAVIVDVDAAIYSSDFRAIETLMQTLMQVAGRVGRGAARGEVVVQTHQPNHPLFRGLLEQDYQAYAQTLLSIRLQSRMPPYSFLALLRCESRSVAVNQAFLNQIRALAEVRYDLDVWGPVDAHLAKKNHVYRHQLLFRSSKRSYLNQLGRDVLSWSSAMSDKPVVWYLEIDPYEVC